jgi:hypothetical protein
VLPPSRLTESVASEYLSPFGLAGEPGEQGIRSPVSVSVSTSRGSSEAVGVGVVVARDDVRSAESRACRARAIRSWMARRLRPVASASVAVDIPDSVAASHWASRLAWVGDGWGDRRTFATGLILRRVWESSQGESGKILGDSGNEGRGQTATTRSPSASTIRRQSNLPLGENRLRSGNGSLPGKGWPRIAYTSARSARSRHESQACG